MERPAPLSAREEQAMATAQEVLAAASKAFGKHGRVYHADMLIQAGTAEAGLPVEEPNRHSEDHWEALRQVRPTWGKEGFGMTQRGKTDRDLTEKGKAALSSIIEPLL